MTRIPRNKQSMSIALSNEQTVLGIFREAESKLTVAEIQARSNGAMTDRSVRRYVKSLMEKGLLRTYGRQLNSTLYGLVDFAMYDDFSDELIPIVPLGNNIVTLETFMVAMVGEKEEPLVRDVKKNVTSTKARRLIQKAMTTVIATSGEAGYSSQVNGIKKDLMLMQAELEYTIGMLSYFIDSAVWFDSYRDRLAQQLRIMQRKNPELYQLMVDFVRGG